MVEYGRVWYIEYGKVWYIEYGKVWQNILEYVKSMAENLVW